MEHGAIVLGTLELKGRTLTLQVNSEPRAERGRALLERLLEGLVATPLIERQTLEQALAEHRQRGAAPVSSGLPPDEERRLVHAQLDRHYRQQLDEPIPMLGDISPRQAAKTAKGRATRWPPYDLTWLATCANDQLAAGEQRELPVVFTTLGPFGEIGRTAVPSEPTCPWQHRAGEARSRLAEGHRRRRRERSERP